MNFQEECLKVNWQENQDSSMVERQARNLEVRGPDFDDMSSFFPFEIHDAIQYINLGYGAQAPKIVIL